ncbi:hypothetical protein BCR34DRAFT_603064 [Clohesyomyces aquaticus]|uniref:Uncharacterized protein n=1 Tax=Clohesyomyces aquaticus TaxID=1231657 RepID=A0A1Y1ZFW9_9PLEO|nr:hypothetical protein BCR34DRAFT_603064 [Clohesyomyces aquaticus]
MEGSCGITQLLEGKDYLRQLCDAVGVPIDAISGDRLENRQASSFSGFASPPESTIFSQIQTLRPTSSFFSTTALSRYSVASLATSRPTGSSTFSTAPSQTTGSSDENNGGGGGGLNTSAKAGSGVSVSLGVLLLAGLIGVAFWMGNLTKRHAQVQQQQQMEQVDHPELNTRKPAAAAPV